MRPVLARENGHGTQSMVHHIFDNPSLHSKFYGTKSYTTRTSMGRNLRENLCGLWSADCNRASYSLTVGHAQFSGSLLANELASIDPMALSCHFFRVVELGLGASRWYGSQVYEQD